MPESEYILHQYQVSPFAAKVRRVFYYKRIPFTVKNYGLTATSAIRKISPTGKLPALQFNHTVIVDSTDIVAHLEQSETGKSVFPEDPELRAQAHIIEDWADESLYFYDLTMRSWPQNADSLAADLIREEKPLMQRLFRRVVPWAISRQAKAQGIGRKTQDDVGTARTDVMA